VHRALEPISAWKWPQIEPATWSSKGAQPGRRQHGASADNAPGGFDQISGLFGAALQLSELGALSARPGVVSDGCRASCVDWYGNARPLFLGGRIFALLGYELVEGSLVGEDLTELRRVSFLQ
jgi:hypothetical protein